MGEDRVDNSLILDKFKGVEVFIVSTDKIRLTMTGENGVVYHKRKEGFWSDCDGEDEGSVLWQGSVFHDYGIRLKPIFVRNNNVWLNIATGKQVVSL